MLIHDGYCCPVVSIYFQEGKLKSPRMYKCFLMVNLVRLKFKVYGFPIEILEAV